jgi:hypothetical protein
MALIETLGLQALSPLTIAVKGGALIAQGCYEDGISEMRRGISTYRASWTTPPGWASSFLAEGLGKVGRHAEGLEALEEGFAAVAKSGEQFSSPSLHHVKGELLLEQNPGGAEAEGCFRIAIEIARRQKARIAELRASTSLARLLNEQGRRDEARTMPAEIYGWFTEGFGTRDLKNAKALLDKLSA